MLGPGKRAVIWFHGCSRECPGCIAKEMNESIIFDEYSPSALYEWVCSCDGIEGITLSGGEPLEQDKEALIEFLELVRNDSRNLGIICYTGYRLEEISSSPVLSYLDILIDGPYIDSQNDSRDLRGSSNQRIHFLTGRYETMRSSFEGPSARQLEIELSLNNTVIINGIPRQGFLELFKEQMHAAGYSLNLTKERA